MNVLPDVLQCYHWIHNVCQLCGGAAAIKCVAAVACEMAITYNGSKPAWSNQACSSNKACSSTQTCSHHTCKHAAVTVHAVAITHTIGICTLSPSYLLNRYTLIKQSSILIKQSDVRPPERFMIVDCQLYISISQLFCNNIKLVKCCISMPMAWWTRYMQQELRMLQHQSQQSRAHRK